MKIGGLLLPLYVFAAVVLVTILFATWDHLSRRGTDAYASRSVAAITCPLGAGSTCVYQWGVNYVDDREHPTRLFTVFNGKEYATAVASNDGAFAIVTGDGKVRCLSRPKNFMAASYPYPGLFVALCGKRAK